MMASTGGVWTQPALGRAADMWGYATSYVLGAGISALAVPFLVLSRRENDPADMVVGAPVAEEPELVPPVPVPVTSEPHPCAPTTVVHAER
jgi:hypothetical protein